MQGTTNICYENCGRRFYLVNFRGDDAPTTVSGRLQNWLDVDGSASGLNEPTLIGSGLADTGLWWRVDDNVVNDPQGPLTFIRQNDGPERGFGHTHLEWDESLHSQVDVTLCGNGLALPCPSIGTIRHRGPKYANQPGLPITAQPDIVGPVGGFGWYLQLDDGAPREMTFDLIEVDPDTPLLMSVVYPVGTVFDITAHAADWCWQQTGILCDETFTAVASEAVVRVTGNTYHFSDDGVLTFRIVQTPQDFVGKDDSWFIPSWDDTGRNDQTNAIDRFERVGVLLPRRSHGPKLSVIATCGGSGPTCNGSVVSSVPSSVDDVCPDGYPNQVSYDRCCTNGSTTNCVFADGFQR